VAEGFWWWSGQEPHAAVLRWDLVIASFGVCAAYVGIDHTFDSIEENICESYNFNGWSTMVASCQRSKLSSQKLPSR
jgi:hypothetical protein